MAASNPICSYEDCNRRMAARGLCKFHYQIAHRSGHLVTNRKGGECSIDGCGKAHYSKGFCQTHYARFRTHGDPEIVKSKADAPLWSRMEGKFTPEPNSGCWLWTGALQNGYGTLNFRGSRVYAHRASYEMHKGEIHRGMHVCHRCDVTICINPDHLWLGTCADNHADRDGKGRQARGAKTHTSKLTEIDVVEIRKEHARGVIPYQLAKRYGVAPSTIHSIIDRVTWKHVA